jgi:[acyl-carrier-protein] S-malonyltransferase
MRDADQHSPGGMAALLGLNLDQAEEICESARTAVGGTIVIANDNCPGQVVVAGSENALVAAMEIASKAGAKRVVRLPISIAAHSPLMARATNDFRQALEETAFHEPLVPTIGNTNAQALTTIDGIRQELGNQLLSRVRWTESVLGMVNEGVTTFLELGSKDVLKGLIKRIHRDAATHVIDSPQGIETLRAL